MNTLRTLVSTIALVVVAAGTAFAWTPVAVEDDPLVRMPGTQPGQVTLEGPNRCLNCHAGYNTAVEPGFNWKGSMMAHSARDFLFYACLTVAAQDSIWAVGRPNAVDICERCHFPKGWLEGRSDPTNASAMTGDDFDGVQCDFCHRQWDPFFETTYNGTRTRTDGEMEWEDWDETDLSGTPSQTAAKTTHAEDQALAQTISLFNGGPFFAGNEPKSVSYTENASGQYFVSSGSQKRASFADAAARHQMLYSRYHKSKYFCATCHDVSNPVLANAELMEDSDPHFLENLSGDLITEQYSAHRYYHVERTFSEFMLSAYGQPGGANTNAEFQEQGAPNILHAAKCQDCHMRDVVGRAANKNGAPLRPDESIEHPNSGQPLHDMTGGNVWVSTVLASAVPGSSNFDQTNADLLNQGPALLTLDLTQGQGIDPVALLAGADRARQQLLLAASIKDVVYKPGSGELSFKIQNNTGHKLISGFPEGRRMFVNVRAYDQGGNLVYEVNPYDVDVGTLKGLPHSQSSPQLETNEVYADELVYEMHPSSTLTGEDETFHFALATGRYKDNRIPPKGFRINEAAERLSVPVSNGEEYSALFTKEEYDGGYDEVSLDIAPGSASVEVNLYYQTTSREYIEFLRDEIKGDGSQTLGDPNENTDENEAYLIQTDPFFTRLAAWGDTIWNLWTHNMNEDGAAPFLMAQATVNAIPDCSLSAPTLSSAVAGQMQVTLGWSQVEGATGYRVNYDQSGKTQWIDDVGLVLTYTDSAVSNGEEYCYKISAFDGTCDSAFSNILCASPVQQGQQVDAGVSSLATGKWVTGGKGKTSTTSFTLTTEFAAGDEVVIQALVKDESNVAIADATVEVDITGPTTVTGLTGQSDASGMAEVAWQTQSPNKRGLGGTATGTYTVTTKNLTASGYTWDNVQTSTTFQLLQ